MFAPYKTLNVKEKNEAYRNSSTTLYNDINTGLNKTSINVDIWQWLRKNFRKYAFGQEVQEGGSNISLFYPMEAVDTTQHNRE